MEAIGTMIGKPCEFYYVQMKMKSKKLNGVYWNWIPFQSSSDNKKKIHRSNNRAQTHKTHNRFAATRFTDLITDPNPTKPTMGFGRKTFIDLPYELKPTKPMRGLLCFWEIQCGFFLVRER